MSSHIVDVNEPAVEGVYNGKLAMWLFLCSEVMFFAGLLGAYMTLRIGNPALFEESQKGLLDHVGLAAFNTVLLITSSLTMALAVVHGQKHNSAKQRLFLIITGIAGSLFIALKAYEYNYHFGLEQWPKTDLFYGFYYTLTGIHAFHIIGGIIPIFGLAYFAGKKDVSCETEMVGLYWHFVDLVWIFLFPLLYLI